MEEMVKCNVAKVGVALLCSAKDRIVEHFRVEDNGFDNLYWVNNPNESLMNISDILYIVADGSNPENISNLKKLVKAASLKDLFTFIIVEGETDIDVNVDGMLIVLDDVLKRYDGAEYFVYDVIKSINNLALEHAGLVDIPFDDTKMFFNQSKKVVFSSAELKKNLMINNLVKELFAKVNMWNVDLKYGKSAMIDITGNEKDLSMMEIMEICELIFDELSQDVFVIWGATIDNNLHDVIRVSMWININD